MSGNWSDAEIRKQLSLCAKGEITRHLNGSKRDTVVIRNFLCCLVLHVRCQISHVYPGSFYNDKGHPCLKDTNLSLQQLDEASNVKYSVSEKGLRHYLLA